MTDRLPSLPDGYRALVIGSSGAIGSAFVALLAADPRCGHVEGLHRNSTIPIDFDDEAGIARAAQSLAPAGPFHLIVNAVGMLHDAQVRPEKRLADVDYARMAATFRVNTFGPAVVIARFAPLLAPDRSICALLSARVGSIGDNRLGGWLSYRASKAALNMVVRTAAVELARTKPGTVIVALHPGTVRSPLSRPFGGEAKGQDPAHAVASMLAALDRLQPADSGRFVAYDGSGIPW